MGIIGSFHLRWNVLSRIFFLLGIVYIVDVVQMKRDSIPPCSAQGHNTNVRNTDASRGTVASITTCAPETNLFLYAVWERASAAPNLYSNQFLEKLFINFVALIREVHTLLGARISRILSIRQITVFLINTSGTLEFVFLARHCM